MFDDKRRFRFWLWLARRLPRCLMRGCIYRFASDVTSGKYRRTIVWELSLMKALAVWDDLYDKRQEVPKYEPTVFYEEAKNGTTANADATLIHKDFAKSKQWSFVGVCCALSPVLTVLAWVGGGDMQIAVMATAGSMLVTHGVITGLNTKKLNKLLKETGE